MNVGVGRRRRSTRKSLAEVSQDFSDKGGVGDESENFHGLHIDDRSKGGGLLDAIAILLFLLFDRLAGGDGRPTQYSGRDWASQRATTVAGKISITSR